MGIYQQALETLNQQQRRAVEQIDGPVLVIAGPGTGKTQLLAMRAAHILKTDTTMLPSNILCLTFTDSAAINMRERLIQYTGQDAYQIAVHTFNSFGASIMNVYPEYFLDFRDIKTADELTTHQIIEQALIDLPGNHVLAGRGGDGTFYSLKQIRNFIADAKKASLDADDIRRIVEDNAATAKKLTPLIQEHWPQSIRAKEALHSIHQLVELIRNLHESTEVVAGITPLQEMIKNSLVSANDQADLLEAKSKTKPFTKWKNTWLEKNDANEFVLTIEKYGDKLNAAADIYETYQARLKERGLADFSDHITWVERTLKDNPDLRYTLQERYQYVMIDEFQDTNRSQLLLAEHITDAPVHEGKPNILAVGDDDQAIYRFQGADIGNIATFENKYTQPLLINLAENYRSNSEILEQAQLVRLQSSSSLEKIRDIDKSLAVTVDSSGIGTNLLEFDTETEHYSFVAQQIKERINRGDTGSSIAVLARQRSQLDDLVPYLREYGIPIDYERRESVLDQPHIVTLLTLARLVTAISKQDFLQVNQLLPEIISHPMWNIAPAQIWKLAHTAYHKKQDWISVIYEQGDDQLRSFADFFVQLGAVASAQPLEQILDELIGNENYEITDEYDTGDTDAGRAASNTSPFKSYYFGDELQTSNPAMYLTLLSHLSTLRQNLRTYQTAQQSVLKINDLVDFVDSYQRAELTMIDTAPHREDTDAVKLMTVHKAKGLEFDTVFVIGLQESTWSSSRGSSNRFRYPPNLEEIRPNNNDHDDSIRLLFVAMTRARQNLYLTYFRRSEDGTLHQPFRALLGLESLSVQKPQVSASTTSLVAEYEQRWRQRHLSVDGATLASLLSETLSTYQLSATHLNNFTDLTIGGPAYFMTQNLLHFPSSMNTYAMYGTVMHDVLKAAHETVIAGKPLHVDSLLKRFKVELSAQALNESDMALFTGRGEKALSMYLSANRSTFLPSQRVEFDFVDQGVNVGEARLKGILDRLDFDTDTKTIAVVDYKTGKPHAKWDLPPSATQHEHIKLHKYRQQLLFYKILVDSSSEWGARGWQAEKGILQFLEPDQSGKIRQLELIYNSEDVLRIQQLIRAVWNSIQNLSFPDISKYPADINGVHLFEQDLIDSLK